MSDLVKNFAFDLQRFADFKGGEVEGEAGITLSSLFNSAGRVWQTSDVEKLADRTYFWENGDAKVSLSPDTDNSHDDGSVAEGITIVKGVYDTPVNDGGRWVYAIQSVEAIDASGVNDSATFATLDGVQKIVNAKGTIDTDGEGGLSGITFSGTGAKTQDDNLDWEVGTTINLDGSGNITTVNAAVGEEITTADGTKVAFTKGGDVTFEEDSFDTVTSFVKDGSAQLDITADGDTKIVLVENATNDDEIIYNFNESGDIIDLTFTTPTGTLAVSTGGASFLVTNDVSEDDKDITIGGQDYKFGDKGDNGGVFVVDNNAVTGFVFRDVGDSITIPAGHASPKLYEIVSSAESAMKVSSDENSNIGDNITEASLGFTVASADNEYTITKTADGYDVEVGDGAVITTDSGATMQFNLQSDSATVAPTAVASFNEAGQLQSIANGTTGGSENTGLSGEGSSVSIQNLTAEEIADNFTINDVEVPTGEGLKDVTVTAKEGGDTELTTSANGVYNIGGDSYTVAGLSTGETLQFLYDENNNIIGLSGVTGNASVTGAFDEIDFNGGIVDIDPATAGSEYTFSNGALNGLRDGDVVEQAGTVEQFNTIEEGQFTILGTSIAIDGDSAVAFGVAGGSEAVLTSITGLSGTATGDINGLTVNGQPVEITGDENNSFRVTGNDTNITEVGALGGSAVDVIRAGAASSVGADDDGQFTFTFKNGEVFNVSGNGAEETFFDFDNSGNVSAVTGLDNGEVISGDFDNGIEVNGSSIAIANGGDDISVANVGGELQISGLNPDATVTTADNVYSASAATDGASGTYTFADGQVIDIAGDSNGVTFEMDGEGHVINVSGLDEGATYEGNFQELEGLGVTETHSDDLNAGDGWFTVAKDSDGNVARISDLAGDVVVDDDEGGVGGASQLITNGPIALSGDINDLTITGDNNVTLGLDEYGDVTSIDGFNGGTIAGEITNVSIDGSEIDIDDDGDGEIVYRLGANGAVIEGVDDSDSYDGVAIKAVGGASKVVTSGDGTYTFFEDQTFEVDGEGLNNELDADVTFSIDDANRIRQIDGVNGTIAGNFEEEITVNGGGISVAGDRLISVTADTDGTQVTGIAGLGNRASIISGGNATSATTDEEGVFTFEDGDKYTVVGDSSVTFTIDIANGGDVTGVTDLKSGTVVFEPVTNDNTLTVNDDALTLTATTDKVSITTDAEGKIIGVAGASGVNGLTDGAIVAATGPVTVNGNTINVKDANNSFDVIVGEDDEVERIENVTGNATVKVTDVVVAADKGGEFVIGNNDSVYTFIDDDNAFEFTTDANRELTDVDAINGSIISDNPDVTLSVNDQEIAINSFDTTPVTITTDGASITGVQGLTEGGVVEGDLDDAKIEMANEKTLFVNDDSYYLEGDADGVIVEGDRTITGLDEGGRLRITNEGVYNVNGHDITVQAGDTVLGYDAGNYAEVFDRDTALIRKDTLTDRTYEGIIEERLGLHNYDGTQYADGGEQLGGPDYQRTDTTVADPLSKEDWESIVSGDIEVDLNRPLEIYTDNYAIDSLTANKDVQTIDLSGNTFTKKVHLYRGAQDLTFNSEGGNMAIVEDATVTVADGTTAYPTGVKNISLGGGSSSNPYGVGDVVIVDAGYAIDNKVNITGGAGKDSVYVRNSVDVEFDMGGATGNADKLITFAASNARVTLTNYDPTSKAGIQIEEPHVRSSELGIAGAIRDSVVRFGDGIISVETAAGVAEITFDGNTSVVGGTRVYLYTPEGDRQGVGFTNSEGGAIDGSAVTDNLILIGNNDGKKTGGSTLIGGIGNDTILAGADDSINAGDGNNLIVLEDSSVRAGATIVLEDGNTVIRNTNNTIAFYSDHGDTLEVDDPANISYNGTDLIINGDGYRATVAAPDKDSISGAAPADTLGLQAGSDYVNQLVRDADGKLWRMAVGGESAVIDVKDDEDIRANYYKAGGVTFEKYNGKVQIDLSDDENALVNFIDTETGIVYDGVTSIEAGEGDTTIKGSDANETFFAGKGNASMYGAGGKNLMVGYVDGSADNITKEGSTTFFVLGQNGDGVNTIKSFAFVNDNNYTNNSIAADMIEIDVNSNYVTENSVEISNSDVVFSVQNRTTGVRESVLVKDAASSYEDEHVRDMRVTDGVIAQVSDDDLYFDKFANFYLATGKNATVKVSNDQDYSKVWLANPEVGSTFVGDIHVIDATEATITAELAGNDYNNAIYAGSGDTSLWGGNFGDDLLVGGTGANRFYYALGNGADTIQGAKDGDVVDLTGITVDDISLDFSKSYIDETGVSIAFNSGGTLRVESTANVNYVVQGQTYALNSDRTGFEKKL